MNTGKPSETLFEAMFIPYGKRAFVHRVTDSAEVHAVTDGVGFTKKQPSDYIVTHDGEMFYAEVKSTTGTRFRKSQVEDGQISAAIRQTAAGGKYFFYVHALAIKKWFRVPAAFVLKSDKKSWSWDDLWEFGLLWK